MLTVAGITIPVSTGVVHKVGVLDPLTNARNRVPDPYAIVQPAAGNTRVGGDTIIVTGGGGSVSPLVVYGDTSQDGVWYQGDPTRMSTHDFGPKPWGLQVGNGTPNFFLPQAGFFSWFGNDVIDAHLNAAGQTGGALDTIGISAYGGAGDDTLIGSQTGDRLAGGSGHDTIEGQRGADLIYGDSGFNVDLFTRQLTMVTSQAAVSAGTYDVLDHLQAGRDTLTGEGNGSAASDFVADFADVIFGDHGIVTQDVEEARVVRVAGALNTLPTPDPRLQRVESVGRIMDLITDEPANGTDDSIFGNEGRDRIFGGNGTDTIDGDAESDVIFGDQGHMSYIAADYFGAVDFDLGTLDLVESVQTDAALGKGDTITDDASDDIIFGGQGDDDIDAGTGQNIVFGDHGRILGVDTRRQQPADRRSDSGKTDDDYQVQVLGLVTSIDVGDVNGTANSTATATTRSPPASAAT